MNETQLHDMFETLTRNPTPSKYETGSIQTAARRRHQKTQLAGVVGSTLLAILIGVLIVGRGTEEPPVAILVPPPPIVPWKALTPIDGFEKGLPIPLKGKPIVVTLALPDYKPDGTDRYRFVVRLSNTANKPVALDPCPSYRVAFQKTVESGYLNCADAPHDVGARGHIDFAMEVSSARAIGNSFAISWQLGAEGSEGVGARGIVRRADSAGNRSDNAAGIGSLAGTWHVTALVGANGESVLTGPDADKAKLSLKDGQVSGTDGCNSVFGSYRSGEHPKSDVRFSLGTTLMACIEASTKTSIELPLVERLSDVRHFSGSGDVLYLHAANWMIIAEFQREPSARACSRCPSSPDSGIVTGRLVFAGGPVSNGPNSLLALSQGVVKFTNSRLKSQIGLDSNGRFTTDLPAGTYTVTATSPLYTFNGQRGICRASEPVQVTKGRTSTVTIYCQIK